MERILITPIVFGIGRQLTSITVIEEKIVFGTQRKFTIQCFDNNGQLAQEVPISLSNEQYYLLGENTQERINAILEAHNIQVINSSEP